MYYLKALSLFFKTEPKQSRKIKAAFWFAVHYGWLADLYQRFKKSGIEYAFTLHPFIFYMCRMHAYVIKGSDLSLLSDRLEGHYQMLDKAFGQDKVAQIHGEGLTIWQRDMGTAEIRVVLQYVHIMRFEGQMCIRLYVGDTCIYYAHVHFYDNAIWVGGIQGGKGQLEQNKILTKASYGIRPQNFIYLALIGIAKKLNLRAIYGISSEYHVYQNENKSKEKVIFDYSAFWQELGAEASDDGVWYSLPLEYPRKPIEDIASKKRSQYRNRYQLMDDFESEILS